MSCRRRAGTSCGPGRVMPDPDDIPLAEVARRLSHSARWLREILAHDRKDRKPPRLQFHHHIGRKPLWTEAGVPGAPRRNYRHRKRAPRLPPGLAIIERDGHWHLHGTLRVAGNSRRVRKSTELPATAENREYAEALRATLER